MSDRIRELAREQPAGAGTYADRPRVLEDAIIPTLVSRASSPREIDVRLAAWGEVASETAEGWSETLEPGAFGDVDPSRVTLESQAHGGAIVGVAQVIHQRAGDAVATFRVASTAAGDELLELVRSGVLRDASIVFAPGAHTIRPDGVVSWSAVDLRRVALLPRGAYPSARVLAYRSASPGGLSTMVKKATPEGDAAAPVASPMPPALERASPDLPTPPPALAPASAPLERVDAIDARLAAVEQSPVVLGGRGVSPLARFASFGEYCRAAFTDKDLGLELERALATQSTGNNAGVLGGGPSWLPDVKGIVDQARPVVSGFGPRPLGASGMTVDWPVFAGDLSTLVAAQASELDEVTSVRVDITAGQGTVATYAGGSRLSKQTIERSTPAYRDAYERIMLAAYAKVTDTAYTTALVAAATGSETVHGLLGPALSGTAEADDELITIASHGLSDGDRVTITALTGGTGFTLYGKYYVVGVSGNDFSLALTSGGAAVAISLDASAITVREILGDDGTALFAALFGASIAVEDATGAPATLAYAGTALFSEIARMSRIVPQSGGPSNAVGTASAASLSVQVGDLTVRRASGLADQWSGMASNGIAAGWHEDGPRPLSADVVGNLGTDVAVYGFGSPGVYVPAGVVLLAP